MVKKIEGGRAWSKCRIAVDGWDSECGNFRIIPSKRSGFILIAFNREDEHGDFWRRTFPTVHAAMEYAERM